MVILIKMLILINFFKNKFREFRTGDYAIKQGRDLYFKNRIDNQIKIKGHRIELDEINHNLERMGFKKLFRLFLGIKFIHLFQTTEFLKKNNNKQTVKILT